MTRQHLLRIEMGQAFLGTLRDRDVPALGGVVIDARLDDSSTIACVVAAFPRQMSPIDVQRALWDRHGAARVYVAKEV